MSHLIWHLRRSTLPVLVVVCLAALTASFAYAEGSLRPLATVIIGDPDAAVTGKFAVGTAVPGSKSLTVAGVIDFLGAGTVHNFFTQGVGNNMQIRSNVDEANTVYDATKSQWNMVMGSSNDMFMIKHSPAGATYNEDALFWIQGSTGKVGIATFDTNNGAVLPFVPEARLHVQTVAGDAIRGQTAGTTGRAVWGISTAASGANAMGVRGDSSSTEGSGVYGVSWASSGSTYGVWGQSTSTSGRGVYGLASAPTGYNVGVFGQSNSTDGYGVYAQASATTGSNTGVYGRSDSVAGRGVVGAAWASTGNTYGVYGQSDSGSGIGVYGYAPATAGSNFGVYGQSDSPTGFGVFGYAYQGSGANRGVGGRSNSPDGMGVYGYASADTGQNYGVYGQTDSTDGSGVFGYASKASGSPVGVSGKTVSANGVGVVGTATSTTGLNYGVVGGTSSGDGYGVFSDGDMLVWGDFQVVLGIKAAVVETESYGWRHLYAMESPQNWFEDFGRATLLAGEAVVPIEEIFTQTVNLEEDYHVFLTPLGNCSLYVADMSSDSFTVRAQEGEGCEIAFDYRIIAPRLDYEDLRLKQAEDPEAVAASIAGLQLPEAPAAP